MLCARRNNLVLRQGNGGEEIIALWRLILYKHCLASLDAAYWWGYCLGRRDR